MSILGTPATHQLKQFSPELIFFDIDGTLLNTQGDYSPLLKQQLERLSASGVKLAIASGRPAIAAQFLFDELPLTDAGLFCTGAELYNPKQEQHLQTHFLDAELVSCLYQEVEKQALYCEFYTTDFYTAGKHNDIAAIHSRHLRVQPKQLKPADVLAQNLPITKLLLGSNSLHAKSTLESLASRFPQCDFAFAHFLARPDWVFASVISRTADKKTGFKRLLEHHNVNAENVMAFGDSHSDMIFLQQAGLGIAMANAAESVKSTADIITLSADDNGVAEALKYLQV